jgi:PIN domain nuclease of toxin-antitoxin system
MNILLDTSILLWHGMDILPSFAKAYIYDESKTLYFSPVSIWEVVIKRRLNRPDFIVCPYMLSAGLLNEGFVELPVLIHHTLYIDSLPVIHKDPFDRILLAQAITEGMPLMTSDKALKAYDTPIIFVEK